MTLLIAMMIAEAVFDAPWYAHAGIVVLWLVHLLFHADKHWA